ncbi:hypothetical protein, partial [Roseibium polysiphoniae]|uniref:hypothetical protein n=1 Tax=Roseibium polysiphoniae TaxID=2571221 RepID=UPI003299C993
MIGPHQNMQNPAKKSKKTQILTAQPNQKPPLGNPTGVFCIWEECGEKGRGALTLAGAAWLEP